MINIGSAFLLPGAILAAIWGLARLMQDRNGDRPAGLGRAGPLADLGRISLTVFIVHHFAGYEAFRAAGAIGSLELPATLGMVLVSWALALLAARAWGRAGFRWSLERALSRLGRPPPNKLNTRPAD